MRKTRLLRITTVPISLKLLLRGQLSFFQASGFEVLAVSAAGEEVTDIVEEGIPHSVVPMTRTISPFRDLVALVRLVAVIRRFRPDIVHSHTPKAGLLGMIAAWLCRVPVRLHTVAGLPLMEKEGVVRWLLLFTEKITYACATRVYPNSTGLQNFIRNSIGTRTPMKIIGNGSSNGINSVFFSPSPELRARARELRHRFAVADDAILFSFIGRIVRDKGVDELLKAFQEISEKNSCKLLLAGPFEDDLDPISDESRNILKNNPGAVAMGYVDDVRPLLLASDVFVFPSYREGFPNVVMQAACMECPCIVTDINGSNEIIRHGSTGLIVPPKSADALQQAMETLAGDPQLRKKFAGSARRFVVEHFDQHHVWNELLSEYHALLRVTG